MVVELELSCKSSYAIVVFANFDAGWSSLAARRAHNPKVAGSNPAPATNYLKTFNSHKNPISYLYEKRPNLSLKNIF